MLKLKLESIYCVYCNNHLKDIEGQDEYVKMLAQFVLFRLDVSGGEHSRCSDSMVNVHNFLEEIFLFERMLDNWNGSNLGEYCNENYSKLLDVIWNEKLPEPIMNEILDNYKLFYGME